jgi:hypothetical protein
LRTVGIVNGTQTWPASVLGDAMSSIAVPNMPGTFEVWPELPP